MRVLRFPHVSIFPLLFASAFVCAQELTVQINEPNFSVIVPGVQQVKFEPHPAVAQNPSAKLMGSSADGVTASVLIPKAEGASDQQCASWLVGSTLARYSPDLGSVQLLPSGANAWVLVYAVKLGPIEQLKAHVFSGNNKGQCIEVHMSRLGANEQQRQAWMSGFRGVIVKVDQ
jgi:hypothetical protein